jgi:hypothetical protein
VPFNRTLKEIPMNKNIDHNGERSRWRSALARKKERAPTKQWDGTPVTRSTKWKGGDENDDDKGATRLRGEMIPTMRTR